MSFVLDCIYFLLYFTLRSRSGPSLGLNHAPSAIMAAMKLNPPVFNSSEKTFERWKVEVQMWSEITDLEKKKMGIAVALSLPENESVRAQVMESVPLDDLKKEDGLSTLLNFMEKTLGKDDMEDSLAKYEEFKNCTRVADQKISDFILDFEQKYNRILKKGIKLPQEILCFELLSSANISKPEKLLILSGINFDKKDNLFEQAKKSLKKFKGDLASGDDSGSAAIKLEPAFVAAPENVLAMGNFQTFRGRPWSRGRGSRMFPSDKSRKMARIPVSTSGASVRPINQKGPDGSLLTCHACGSYRHLVASCPYSYENAKMAQQVLSDPAEKVVLFTGYNKDAVQVLGEEAINCAVLDTACTSTVCGQKWFQCYLSTLPDGEMMKIQQTKGQKVFKFGGGEVLQSLLFCELPCNIAGKDVVIEVDVVKSAIPLLLSLKSLKKANAKLNIEKDTAEFFGTEVPLNFTSSGHYCIPIGKTDEIRVQEVCNVVLSDVMPEERKKILQKLHKQFAHPSMPRLKALMADAGVWKDQYNEELCEIYDGCQTCKMYKKTPARPVVSMPMASRFNEKIAIDLKSWKGKYILHMIDMFTRLSVSVFINSKSPPVVVEKIIQHWIGAGWGVMEGIFFDNGGEFNNSEMREVASILNIQLSSTPAESPWSNGLCERNHHITDRMLEILTEENPKTDQNTLLAWANVAKNSLQMWNGFSSYQLVLGKNPNLPNIMSEKLPALQGTTSSEILKTHLDALFSARKAFIQCEADERIRRALRHPIRATDDVFNPGDRVFYKRDGSQKWLGPGKVLYQDGKVVFVRHAGVYVRVSTNRLIKDVDLKSDAVVVDQRDTNPNMSVPLQRDSSSCATISKPQLCENLGALRVGQEQDPETQHHEDIEEQPQFAYQQKISLRKNDQIEYKINENDPWITGTVLGRAGKASTSTKYWFNVEDKETGEEKSLNFEQLSDWRKVNEEIDLVTVSDTNSIFSDVLQAKHVELRKLKDFDVYDVVEDVGQPCISTKWVITRKDGGMKARLVARGFEETQYIESNSPTVAKTTMRILLATALSNGWTVKSSDITSAFLQGKQIQRDVFIKPPPEAAQSNGALWKLKKTLYGLADAARQFYDSVKEELINLGMKQSKVDSSLFYMTSNTQVTGALIMHIDDFLHCGNEVFEEKVLKPLAERFTVGRRAKDNFTYIGFDIKQTHKGITISQGAYVENIQSIKIDPGRAKEKKSPLTSEEQKQFRRIVGQCNWVSQGTRPDLAFDVVEMSSKFNSSQVSDLLRANKSLLRVRQHNSIIRIPHLGPCKNWHILVFSDASLANMCDGVSSMGGHIILLLGMKNAAAAIAWSCAKIKRVVKSTLAAEMLSLADALDHAIYLQQVISELTSFDDIPIDAFVDNKSVVEAVYSTKSVEDKRLRIDVGSVKELLDRKTIKSVQWIPGEQMLANPLTKLGASCLDLLKCIQQGRKLF